VDPKDLVEAIEDQVCRGDLDYRSQEPFGQLHVSLVDACDVFLSKLFSARIKDRDDLRMLAPQLDKGTIMRRLRDTTQDLLAAPNLREKAEQNWYIIYGESLPN